MNLNFPSYVSNLVENNLFTCDLTTDTLSDNFKVSGVYAIINVETCKIYVGQAQNLYDRYRKHTVSLHGNYHKNPILQNSFNTYGSSKFKFFVLKLCSINNLDLEEQLLLDGVFGKNSFNVCSTASTTRGIKFSRPTEFSEQRSEEAKRRWGDDEYRNRMLAAMTSEDYKRRASEQMIEINKNPEIIAKKSKDSTERWKSEEHREKYNLSILKSREEKLAKVPLDKRTSYERKLERERNYATARRAEKKAEREVLLSQNLT